MAFRKNHSRQGSESSVSSIFSESSSIYEQSSSSTYTSSATASGILIGSSSTAPQATCAYPSWPAGRSLKAFQPRDASPRRMTVAQYKASPVPFVPVPKRSQSSYSTGASAFLSDDDLMVPETTTALRHTPDEDFDDCLAPGYHCLSGRPRAPEPKFKWERSGEKTRKNSRPVGGPTKKADPRQQIRMPTKKGALNG